MADGRVTGDAEHLALGAKKIGPVADRVGVLAGSAGLIGREIAEWIVAPQQGDGPPRPAQRNASSAALGALQALGKLLQHSQVMAGHLGSVAEETGKGFATLSAEQVKAPPAVRIAPRPPLG